MVDIAVVDDPANDLFGTVRRVDGCVWTKTGANLWRRVHGKSPFSYESNAGMAGSTVIGAVPGTPADTKDDE